MGRRPEDTKLRSNRQHGSCHLQSELHAASCATRISSQKRKKPALRRCLCLTGVFPISSVRKSMKAVCLALVALALTQVVAGQTQAYTSTLFQTFNSTSEQVGFLQCNESRPVVGVIPGKSTNDGAPLTPVQPTAAGEVVVDAVWFGGEVGPASNFQVVGNCSVLQLTSNGGHGTTLFTGPVPAAPNGCSVDWYQSTSYLHLFVSITNTGYAWSVSLPTETTVRAQTACNGGYQYCPLATEAACGTLLNSPTTLNPDGTMGPATSPMESDAEAPVPSSADSFAPTISPRATTTEPTATLG